MKNVTIRPIEVDEIAQVADMIATGYHDDIFFKWSVSSEDARHKIVANYYMIYLMADGCVAHVAETPDHGIVGATVWLPHDTNPSIYDDIDLAAGKYARQFRAVCDFSHYSEPPMAPFYQLVGFVVKKSMQGAGIGEMLLMHHLNQLDKQGIPTYLEASTPYFGGGVYGKCGYQPVGELMVFTKIAILYPCWRPAASAKHHELSESGLIHVARAETTDTWQFGKYEWLVLTERDGKALLLAKDVIKLAPYHDTYEDVAWPGATIRHYLNGDFYNSFTTDEQAAIHETELCNLGNPWYPCAGATNTRDKIFLLSAEEVAKYLGLNGDITPDNKFYVSDQHNHNRVATCPDGAPSRWWLRTPGNMPNFAACITVDGRICATGDFVNRPSTPVYNIGIRPAMWVKL